MPQACLQLIFRTTANAKLLYTAPALWDFANFGDMELPSKNNSIDECNFIYRVLYKDCF